MRMCGCSTARSLARSHCKAGGRKLLLPFLPVSKTSSSKRIFKESEREKEVEETTWTLQREKRLTTGAWSREAACGKTTVPAKIGVCSHGVCMQCGLASDRMPVLATSASHY